MLRAVLFDYGLTLVSFSYPRQELLRVLEEARPWLGPRPPEAEWLLREVLEPLEEGLDSFGEDEVDYMRYYGDAWRRAGLDLPPDTLWRILDLEQRCWDRSVRPAPDALETLAALRVRGLRLGVASNAPFPPAMLHRQLRVNGIEGAVDAVVFSSEVGRRKPAPELYTEALSRLDVAPHEVLHVGDKALEDYDGPRRLGMQAVLCTALARRPPPPGVPTIRRLGELLGWPSLPPSRGEVARSAGGGRSGNRKRRTGAERG